MSEVTYVATEPASEAAVVQEQPKIVSPSASPKKHTDRNGSGSQPSTPAKAEQIVSSDAGVIRSEEGNAPSNSSEVNEADVVKKTEKLTKGQRKNRAKAAKKAAEGETEANTSDNKDEKKATENTGAVAMSVDAEGIKVAKEPRRKLSSSERRKIRDEKAAAAKASEAAVTTKEPPLPAPASTFTAAPAPAASSTETKERAPRQKKIKSTADEPKAVETKTAPAPAPVSTASKPAPASTAAQVSTNGTAQPQQAVLKVPGLKADQHIALHAVLNVLQQGVRTQSTHIAANAATLKAHLLHSIAQLGYTCVEGSAQAFQRVAWHATDDCLDYSPPIIKAPEQFLQSTKTKGDLKLEAPALFLQCRAYPDFGADSPLLQGAKAFKANFLRQLDEVAMAETDALVFVAAEKVYQEYALSAVSALPAATDVQRHMKTFTLPHATKTNISCQLRCVVGRVETVSGDSYIVGAVLP